MEKKEKALKYIRTLAEQKIITRDELEAAYDAGCGIKVDTVRIKKFGLAEILYYIGGAIVFLGISIFLWQSWPLLGFGTKVLATLCSGIAAYIVGLLFSRDERTENVSPAFYFISALITPIGLWVVLDNAGFDASGYSSQTLISGILLITYLLSYFVIRKNVFMVFSIIFGTWFFFSLTSFMIGGGPSLENLRFYEYRVLVTGISYLLLGYSFSKSERAPLRNFLYNFGVLSFLGATLALGGWDPNQDIFWESIYPGFVFGAIFLSVYVKSKAFLLWGTLFLLFYILKITSEYFSGGLGWPLALVIAGLAMIGVGYMSLSLKKKYLSV